MAVYDQKIEGRLLYQMNKILIGLTTLLAFSAFSGGVAWSFEITHFAVNKNDSLAYTFKAVPTKKDNDSVITLCDEITVTGDYDYWRWFSFGKKRFISRATHVEAMAILQNAYQAKTAILFGSMGSGLKQTGTCQYQSKGLFHGQQDNGEPFVMSVYNKI